MAWPWIVGAAVLGAITYIANRDGSSSRSSSSSSENEKNKFKNEEEAKILKDVTKSLGIFFKTHTEIIQVCGEQGKERYKELCNCIENDHTRCGECLKNLDAFVQHSPANAEGLDAALRYIRDASSMKLNTSEDVENALDMLYGQSPYHYSPSDDSNVFKVVVSPSGVKNGMLALVDAEETPRHVIRFSPALKTLFPELHQLQSVHAYCKTLEDHCDTKEIVDYARSKADFAEILQQWRENRAALADAPRVIVCGMLKAGKSTLLNMLTGHFTEEYFPSARIRETVALKTLKYDDICYVDTPGLDAPKEDEEKAWSAMASADVILFVHNVANEFEQYEKNILQRLARLRPDFAQSCILVGSFAETRGTDAAQRLEALKGLQQRCQSITQVELPAFLVSSTAYKKGCLENKNNLRKSAGVDDLKAALQELLAHAAVEQQRETRLQELQRRLLGHVTANMAQNKNAIEFAYKHESRALLHVIKDLQALLNGFKAKIESFDSM